MPFVLCCVAPGYCLPRLPWVLCCSLLVLVCHSSWECHVQVIKGTYTQTNQLQGFNALAPSASQNLSSHLASAIGAAQVPSTSINEALSDAAMPGSTAQVRTVLGAHHSAPYPV